MKNDRIIIFGAGADGVLALDRIGADYVEYFVDNDKDKHGRFIRGKKVISFEELCELNNTRECEVVISSEKYYSEMFRQLKMARIESIYSISSFIVKKLFKDENKNKRIILMNTHAGINIGDQIITEAELLFLKTYLTNFEVIELPADIINDECFSLNGLIIDSDIIAISGGGYMGSLWKSYGEENVREIVGLFPNNTIIILPQSIFYENDAQGDKEYKMSMEIYKQHSRLKICTRELTSYSIAKKLLRNDDNVFLIPDMALIFDKSDLCDNRMNVGVCLRNDKERVVTDVIAEKIKSQIISKYILFDMLADKYICIEERKRVVDYMISKVAGFKYVITDRLHCMILCVITGTPCIVLDNLTGKVFGVYEWIKNNPYIHIVKDIEEVEALIEYCEKDNRKYYYDMSKVIPYYQKLISVFLSDS